MSRRRIGRNVYTIKRVIGRGVWGTVVEAERQGGSYAIKTQAIRSEHDSILRNELLFDAEMAQHNPTIFVAIVQHSISKKCNLPVSIPSQFEHDKHAVQYIRKRYQSGMCCHIVYPKMDHPLVPEWILKSSWQERASFLAQMWNAIAILQHSQWVHGDVHEGNIAFLNTKQTFVDIQNVQVPTFQKIYKLIDYGSVMHPSIIHPNQHFQQFSITENDHYWSARTLDGWMLTQLFIKRDRWFGELNELFSQSSSQLNVIDDVIEFEDMYVVLQSQIEFQMMQSQLAEEFKNPKDKHEYRLVRYMMFEIMFPTLYQQLVLKTKFRKTYAPKLFMPLDCLFYIARNLYNPEHIARYFAEQSTSVN